jgi:hypothetical protein
MMSNRIIFVFLLLVAFTAVSLHASHPKVERFDGAMPSLYQTQRADSAHGFDITKYEIYLTVNDQTHNLSGKVITYVTAEETLSGIDYNLIGLTVSQVKVNNVVTTFTHQNGILHIPLVAADGQQFTTEVTYSGIPQLSPAPYNIGVIFSASTVFTLSDPDAGRYWWPSYDHPWDKAVVDLHITMRNDWLVACNGLRESIVDNGNGTKTHNWLGSNPMATYLVCFTAGAYQEINQTAGDIPVQNFVLASQYNNAVSDFASLPSIIQFYETQFGDYPFEKYGNATVSMTTYGAMEHQTMTTLGMQFITGNGSGELVIAHELAHQWYGNCLTPLTFKDVWLSEGFATYSEALWVHKKSGWQAACNYINTSFHNYYIGFENANSSLPNIIYDPPFNYYFYPQSYEKAASVLHMLRLKIGNAHFFELLQTWFATYHNSNVVTAEFKAMAEQISGQDLTQFFNQWIFSRGLPSVEYTLMQNNQTGQGRIIGKSLCSTGTIFDLDIPFSSNQLVAGDSLIFRATAAGFASSFSILPNVPVFNNITADPKNWVLDKGYVKTDVNLTQCLPSNNAIMLRWNSFEAIPDFSGYHVYRKQTNEQDFVRITDTPLTVCTYLDDSVQNNVTYQYRVVVADNEGFESNGSSILNATPVEFTFDWGLLVVDETRNGTGSILSPTDAMVDDFYHNGIAPFPYTSWDFDTMGSPTLSTLSHYPAVIWHSDDYSQIQLGASLSVLSSYIFGGGNLMLSGWKAPSVFTDDFMNMFMPGVNLVYDSQVALISAQGTGYPLLVPDSDKLTPSWNGMMSMIYTFQNAEYILYTAQMTSTSTGNGLPIAARFSNHGKLILFGMPLYYMQASGFNDLMDMLLPQLIPVPNDDEHNAVAMPVSLSCYPNPFNQQLSLRFNQKLRAESKLKVYNTKGQLVSEIDLAQAKTSATEYAWKAVDNSGKALPNGVYLIRYSDSKNKVTSKVMLIR